MGEHGARVKQSTRGRALAAGALTTGVLIAGATEHAPKAEATCLSISGVDFGSGCKSAPLSIAIGVGSGATARALHPFTIHIGEAPKARNGSAGSPLDGLLRVVVTVFRALGLAVGPDANNPATPPDDGSGTIAKPASPGRPPRPETEKAGAEAALAKEKAAADKAAADKAAADKAAADKAAADKAEADRKAVADKAAADNQKKVDRAIQRHNDLRAGDKALKDAKAAGSATDHNPKKVAYLAAIEGRQAAEREFNGLAPQFLAALHVRQSSPGIVRTEEEERNFRSLRTAFLVASQRVEDSTNAELNAKAEYDAGSSDSHTPPSQSGAATPEPRSETLSSRLEKTVEASEVVGEVPPEKATREKTKDFEKEPVGKGTSVDGPGVPSGRHVLKDSAQDDLASGPSSSEQGAVDQETSDADTSPAPGRASGPGPDSLQRDAPQSPGYQTENERH
ncbi:hypothetical protein [Mycolicibacterium madagascariense]|nr:hypothetical protein [Mycolicibacterium madagascariense]MCV7013987.1 hypothetical protein [Mycolicibacterium madagascariense]